MIKYIMNLWHKRQRDLDIKILWPICKKRTLCLAEAKGIFMVHCFMDPAWNYLDDKTLADYIDELE